MGITVYPPATTTSSSSTTTDSTQYSWGRPKLGTCMQFTSECSNTCFCFCCNDVTASNNGATNCLCFNNQWAVHPLGDNCVVVTKSSIWNLVAQVFAISDSGALSSMGTSCELYNWMCEFSCCSSSCCYNYPPNVANSCIRNTMCKTEATDAAGRLYAAIWYGNNDCYCAGYTRCTHTKGFCFNPTDCTWCECSCTYKNGLGGGSSQAECAHFALITNPAKGMVAVRHCFSNCTGQNCQCTRYFIHGNHCELCSYCTGCTTTYCQNRPVYFGRTGDNTFLAMFHCELVSNRQPGYKLTVDFDNCTVTRGDCMPRLTVSGNICNINPHGTFPIAGSTVNYLMTNFFVNNCSNCCWVRLNNIYVTANGSVYDKMESCSFNQSAGCYPDEQHGKGRSLMEWAFGSREQTACCCCVYYESTCNNRCQFNCMGAKMVNGYYSGCCHYETYDIAPIRGDTDYAPFDIAIGKVCLRKGISDATGCESNCHRSGVVVGSDWIAQLCENGQATGYQCAKLAIYGVNSSCGS